MRLVQPDAVTPTASNTWLFEPTNVDSGLNNYRSLDRFSPAAIVETNVALGEHYIQLDLKFLRPAKAGTVVQSGDGTQSFALAKRVANLCEERRLGRNRTRYLISDPAANRHFGDMRQVYVQTLACVIECGPDWIEDVCHRYGVSRWRQDLRPTYELLIALKNTVGRWPESAWSDQAVGFLMDFVNFLIIRGLPQRQIVHFEEWRPMSVALDNGGRVLTFVPPGPIEAAVPTVLLDSDYVRLARLWVLERRESHGPHRRDTGGDGEWTLLGKSVLFGDDLGLQRLHSRSGSWREQEKVFGRDDAHGQLFERSLHSRE